MRLLADECCHRDLVRALRGAGHDMVTVGEDQPSIDDRDVLELAFSMRRVPITDDKDFGELAVMRRQQCHGVILLRTQNI